MSSHRTLTALATVGLLLLAGLVFVGNGSAQVAVEKPFHYNMKVDDNLSPETEKNNENEQTKRINADYDQFPGTRSNRRQVDVGTWTTQNAVQYDFNTNGQITFNLWFREIDEGYDNSPDWEWTITINEQDYGPYQLSGSDSQTTWIEIRLNANPGVTLIERGFNIDLNIKYTGWEDVDIAYDSPAHASGFYMTGNPVGAFDATGYNGRTATLEVSHPFGYNLDDALKGNFIQLILDGQPQDNNLSQVQPGKSYEWRNTTVTTHVIIWNLDTAITDGANPHVDFALGPVTNPSMSQPFNFTLEFKKASNGDDDSPGLGPVATLGVVAMTALMVATLRRRG